MTATSLSSIVISPEWQARLRRWFNFHRVLWVLALVCFFIAWNRGLALLYGLFSLLMALILLSYLMPNWQLRRIQVRRRHPNDFTAGGPGSITYDLEAGGPRYHVELKDTLEFAEENHQHFFFDKISGRTSCTLQFKCRQRGCFRLGDIRLSSAYPFGIAQFSKSIPCAEEQVLVFPGIIEFSRLPAPLLADTTTWGHVLIPQKGGRDEFTTVREYCHGDELSRIHWAVSARHRHLVVKEYEKTDRPALLVVLDCRKKFNLGEGNRSTFEYAVSIAASMIRYASRQGLQCFLAARDKAWHEMTIQAFSADLYALYELLARLNADGDHPYHAVVARGRRRFPQAGLVATFRLDSDGFRPDLLPRTTQIELEMDADSFRHPHQPGEDKPGRQIGNRWIFSVGAHSNLENLFR